MKNTLLMLLLFMLLGVSCSHTVQRQEKIPPADQGQPLKIESDLIQEGYELFGVKELDKSLPAKAYILARKGDTQLTIHNAEEFAQIVREIASQDEALELVRLMTSQKIRPFLADIYYSEIHKKVEPETEDEKENRWFAIETEEYDAWQLHEPLVTDEDEGYKIERFVATYPRIDGKDLTKAQLVKIWEWIDAEGKYSAEIQDVISEGEGIQKILIFSK